MHARDILPCAQNTCWDVWKGPKWETPKSACVEEWVAMLKEEFKMQLKTQDWKYSCLHGEDTEPPS